MTHSETFVKALLDLGTVTTVDLSKLSPTTLRSMLAHIRLLQRNGYDLRRETFEREGVSRVLDSLRDSHEQPLTDGYKRQIFMTLKRMYPDLIVNKKLNFSKHSVKKTRLSSDEFVDNMRKLLRAASRYVGSIYDSNEITSLGTYDACIAALITSATSLRIHEITNLRLSDVQNIRANRAIGIRSKASHEYRAVALNDLLDSTFDAITTQRDAVRRYIESAKNALHKSVERQRDRFQREFIIISSEDHLRKRLKELAASVGVSHSNIGFNSFRSYITSVLTDGGGHEIAQSMNNHRSVNTTLENYNVITSGAMERTYDNLGLIMDSLLPSSSTPRDEPPARPTIRVKNFASKNDFQNTPNVLSEKKIPYETSEISRQSSNLRAHAVGPINLFETPENSRSFDSRETVVVTPTSRSLGSKNLPYETPENSRSTSFLSSDHRR